MIRFLKLAAASAVGLVLDIALALLLRGRLHLPLALASGISFVTVAALNYLLFEYLVFRSAESAISAARLGKVLATSAAALGVRVTAVAGLSWAAGPGRSWQGDAAILVAAAGASLLANFVMLRTLVFRGR